MATIRKRGSSWQVQIRRLGQPSITRSFKKKPDADAWARQTEAEIDRRGLAPSRSELERITVGNLLQRYRDTVVVHKKCRERETHFIGVLLRHRMTGFSLGHATPDLFRQFRDQRLKAVKASSVRRELAILQHAFNVAIKEWGVPLAENPVAAISKPSLGSPRNRRLREGERQALLNGARQSRVWWLGPIIHLALETGMRRGEILNIQHHHIDLERQTLSIPVTKNGHARTIPLTDEATALLRGLQGTDGPLFPVSANAVRLAWARLKKRIGIIDLRFHDLRHEAISSFFEKGLTMPEVALISGHHDPRMLFRYTHLRAQDVGIKMRNGNL